MERLFPPLLISAIPFSPVLAWHKALTKCCCQAPDQDHQQVSSCTNPMYLQWLPIKFTVQFKVLVITFRALHGQAPAYIKELLQPYYTRGNLRSSHQGWLVGWLVCSCSCSRIKTKGKCSFEVEAPKLWSSHLKKNKRKEKNSTHLFRLAFVSFFLFLFDCFFFYVKPFFLFKFVLLIHLFLILDHR